MLESKNLWQKYILSFSLLEDKSLQCGLKMQVLSFLESDYLLVSVPSTALETQVLQLARGRINFPVCCIEGQGKKDIFPWPYHHVADERGVTSDPHSHTLWASSLTACQQDSLYCVAYARCRACTPKCCSWRGMGPILPFSWPRGQLSRLLQVSRSDGQGAMGKRGHYPLARPRKSLLFNLNDPASGPHTPYCHSFFELSTIDGIFSHYQYF